MAGLSRMALPARLCCCLSLGALATAASGGPVRYGACLRGVYAMPDASLPLRVRLGLKVGTVIRTPPHNERWLVVWDGQTVGDWYEVAELEVQGETDTKH